MIPSLRSKVALVLLTALFAFNLTALVSSAGANDASDESDAVTTEEAVVAEEEASTAGDGPAAEEAVPIEEAPVPEEAGSTEEMPMGQADPSEEEGTEEALSGQEDVWGEPSGETALSAQVPNRAFDRADSTEPRSKLEQPDTWTNTRIIEPLKRAAPANNGTVKIDGAPYDDDRDNEPHVASCEFEIDFFNFDDNETISWALSLQDPTDVDPPGDVTKNLLLSGNVTMDDDSPPNPNTDLDAEVFISSASLNAALFEAYQAGARPHQNQGWKVDLDTGSGKQKIFWIDESCGIPGSIRIAKELHGSSSPNPPAQSFNFAGKINVSLENGQMSNIVPVPPGTYEVTEGAPPANWSLEQITCSDGDSSGNTTTRKATFVVSAGESVTCTFFNRYTAPVGPKGHIKIVKELDVNSDPVPAGSYTFDLDGAVDQNLVLTNANAFDKNDTGFLEFAANPIGATYDVTEDLSNLPSSAWSLTGVACNDPTQDSSVAGATASIRVNDGEQVTCTFTNKYTAPAQTGTISVVKALAQTSDSPPNDGPFGFQGAFSGNLDINGSYGPQQVPAPASYAVSETSLPANWSLDSISCTSSDGAGDNTPNTIAGNQVTMNVSANEDVVCTFFNKYTSPPIINPGTPGGTIIVDKVTDPAGSTQSFDFTLTPQGGTAVPFSLSDTATPFSSNQPAGTYSVAETVPTGWDLESATCSDGSPASAIALSGGEVVTCTFSNAQRGTIAVDKVTDPAGSTQSFDFTLTPQGGTATPFALTDAAAPFSSSLPAGTYTVAETVPDGWDLTTATCSDGSVPSAISLASGESVTCTFTNTERGSITVTKDAIPLTTSTQTFGFSGDLTGDLGDGDSVTQEVVPGTYTVTEEAVEDWELTSIACDDPSDDSSGNPSTGTATFEVAAGEDVLCEFTNVEEEVKGDVIPGPAKPEEPRVLPREPLPLTGTDWGRFIALAGLLVLVGIGTVTYVKKTESP